MCSAFDKNLRFVNKFLLWDQALLKWKMRWSDDDDETSTKRMNYTAHRESLTKLSKNVEWKKANHRKKKKKIEFKQVFRIICDSSSNLWRLIRWARIWNHKSKDTSKISNFSRRNVENNTFEMITNFEFKIRLLSNFFFQTRSKLISSTCRVLIISTSFWNRHFLSRKMKFDKQSNDANRTMRQNLTTFSIAFSKYSLTNCCRIW